MFQTIDDSVQVLLNRPGTSDLIVSCYANTSQADGFQSTWSQHLKSEAAMVEARLAGDRAALDAFAENLRVIREVLASPEARRARGVAIFSAARDGFLHMLPIGLPVQDRLVLDEAPYLVPLLEAIHRQRRFLVVVTDSHHGRLYSTAWGQVRLVRQIERYVPRRQKSAGETWGKQQAAIVRHREDHLRQYRRALVLAIEEVWGRFVYHGIVLLGERQTAQAVREMLPSALAGRVVHTGRLQWARRRVDLESNVQEVLEATLRDQDGRLIEDLERRLREHHLIAAGPQEVVNALREGQVSSLVLEPDRGEVATRCTRCASVFTTMPAVCPYCRGTCEKVNLWQEILLFAARHGIAAHTIPRNPELSRHGGVAAVLSREEPWRSVG